MRHGTEGECLDHEKHSFNHFTTENLTENGRILDATTFAECCEEGLELLDSSNPCNTDLSGGSSTLVLIGCLIWFKWWVGLFKDE